MDQDKIKERIKEKCQIRMHRLFRRALATVEQQVKDFGIKDEFFSKDNKKGFGLIRKTVLDNGNELLDYINGVLDLLNIEQARATIEIPEEIMKEIKDDSDTSKSGSRYSSTAKIPSVGKESKKIGNKPKVNDSK